MSTQYEPDLVAAERDRLREVCRANQSTADIYKAENEALREALIEATRCLEFVLAGEDSRPAKWLIPGNALRDKAIKQARLLLSKAEAR